MQIKKVLVVDDSKVAHLTLRKMLMERSIEVDWVGSGEDSLTYLQKETPDVVFMDVMMPGMDGFETLQAIGKDTTMAKSPVVMCSANATDEDREVANRNGAVDFLSKPYSSHELDNILERVSTLPQAAATPVIEEPVLAEVPAMAAAPSVAAVPAAAVASGAGAEEIARSTAEAISRKATQVAAHAAKTISEKTAREVATEVAQAAISQASLSAPAVEMPDMNSLRGELEQSLQASVGASVQQSLQSQIAQQVQTGLQQSLGGEVQGAVQQMLGGDGVQQQIQTAVQAALQAATPGMEASARDAANAAAQQAITNMPKDSLAQEAFDKAGSAKVWGVLGFLLALLVGCGIGYLMQNEIMMLLGQ